MSNRNIEIPEMLKIFSDPRLSGIIHEILIERKGEAEKRLPPEPKILSGSTIPSHVILIKCRKILTWTAIAFSLILIVDLCTEFIPYSIVFANCGWLISAILAAVLVTEVFSGAGFHIQRQYQIGEDYRREYNFVPSLNRILQLLGVVIAIVFGNIIGFSDAYFRLSQMDPASFSERLTGFKALYFSTITFATVGYGDIIPKSILVKAIVLIQIIFSFINATLVLGTIIAWMLSQRQRQMEDAEKKMRRTVERREATFKEAGLGLYGDTDSFLKEIIDRARKRGIIIDQGPDA